MNQVTTFLFEVFVEITIDARYNRGATFLCASKPLAVRDASVGALVSAVLWL